ncbi:MAG: hypothetical protein RR396_02210 [Clostridiales bacterium]
MSMLEALMLLSFGAAWPASIYKSYTSKSVKGKSGSFLLILIFGYICGIANKFLYFPDDPVVYLYILNTAMVSFDFFLFLRNRKYEAQQENSKIKGKLS